MVATMKDDRNNYCLRYTALNEELYEYPKAHFLKKLGLLSLSKMSKMLVSLL